MGVEVIAVVLLVVAETVGVEVIAVVLLVVAIKWA